MAWGTQRDWRWCSKCQGSGSAAIRRASVPPGARTSRPAAATTASCTTPPARPARRTGAGAASARASGSAATRGPCPAGGKHIKTGSGNYTLAHRPAPGRQGWRWCSKCQGHVVPGNNHGRQVPRRGGHIRPPEAAATGCAVTSRIRIHIKILTGAEHLHRHADAQHARGLRRGADRRGMGEHREAQSPDAERPGRGRVHDGQHDRRTEPAVRQPQQRRLQTRSRSISCAAPCRPSTAARRTPPGSHRCCVVQGATQWTMAHEVGHVLGLSHVNNNDRLMTGNGTGQHHQPAAGPHRVRGHDDDQQRADRQRVVHEEGHMAVDMEQVRAALNPKNRTIPELRKSWAPRRCRIWRGSSPATIRGWRLRRHIWPDSSARPRACPF